MGGEAKNTMNQRRIVNLIAYFVLGLVALSLVVKYIATHFLNLANITDIIDQVALYSTLFVTVISAFSYAKTRRNIFFMTFLLIFLVVIVVFTFIIKWKIFLKKIYCG